MRACVKLKMSCTIYCYNYLPSHYLCVRSSVIDNLFTLFPLVVAGTATEVNSQFFQFVSLGT